MKTRYILSLILLLVIATKPFAQANTKTDTLAVNGNCGMCKKNIETAAKSAGASYALWDKDSKQLIVKFTTNKTSSTKIEQAIAAKGYDTKNSKATDAAYNKLDECCQYDRSLSFNKKEADCCKGNTCSKDCCKTDMSCCKGKDAKHDCCSAAVNCCSKTN